jgi:ATP-binding cassette subfamily B protein
MGMSMGASFGSGRMGGVGGFGGVPSEMLDAMNRLAEHEPPPVEREIHFVAGERAWVGPMGMGALLRLIRRPLIGVVVLVVLETIGLHAGPRLITYAFNHGIEVGDFGVVKWCAGLYLAGVLLATVTGTARVAWGGRLGERVMYRLRLAVFTHLQRLGLDFYTAEKSGVVMTRMTSDVEALQNLLQEGYVQFLVQILTLVFGVVMLFTINAELAAIMVFGVMPIITVATVWFRLASDRGYALARNRVAALLGDLQENLSGIRVVTAYNRQRRNADRHRQLVGSYNDANRTTVRAVSVYAPIGEGVSVWASALVVAVGGRMYLRGELTVGDMIGAVLYLNTFMQPLTVLTQFYNQYQQARAGVLKLKELFEIEPSVVEQPGAPDLPPLQGEIELRGVTFGYLPDKPVLVDANLHFRAGETIAFVGPTGAGKSTIAKLLARFYDPQEGQVLLDGHDVRGVTLSSVRRQLGVVPQEGFLFAGDIRENIRFGHTEATDEEILAACEAIGVGEFIDRLPEGLDTPCHERGVTLSSGERQLIALARALLTDPRVLVLDEATSNLDLATEAMIERALDVLLEGRTAILIAHRLNTARRADRIVVVDHGGIAGIGRHEDLLETCPTYVALHAAWSAGAVDTAA